MGDVQQQIARVTVPGIISPCWKPDGNSQPMDLGAVLDGEDIVTFEMAPPREPRTWPKLDPVPDDLTGVRGASGTRYRRGAGTAAFHGYRDGVSVCRSIHALQVEDGPLTEDIEP